MEYIQWPLAVGQTLITHEWFPIPVHKILNTKFMRTCLMENQREVYATATMLFYKSLMEDPAGTLPTDDTELALMAGIMDVAVWQAQREQVLTEWSVVHVECDGEDIQRLGHMEILAPMVADMSRRKRGRDDARTAGQEAVRKSRIRKKMKDLQVSKAVLRDERALHVLSQYFAHSGLYITADNVRAAMENELGFGPNVAHFEGRTGGDAGG